MKSGLSYYNVHDKLRTGDVILFKGAEFVSNYISKIEKYVIKNNNAGSFTHAGFIIMRNDFPVGSPYREHENSPNIPYIFESTCSGLLGDGVNNVRGHGFLGVQLRKFSDVIDAYDRSKNSVVCWCKLKEEYRNKINNELLFDIFNNYNGRMYALSFIDLITCAFPKLRFLRKLRCKKNKWQFCSQLVANIFKDLGILNESVHAENVLPCDFLVNSDDDKYTYDTDKEIPVLFELYNNITIYKETKSELDVKVDTKSELEFINDVDTKIELKIINESIFHSYETDI